MAIGNIDHSSDIHKALSDKTSMEFMPMMFKPGSSSFGLST